MIAWMRLGGASLWEALQDLLAEVRNEAPPKESDSFFLLCSSNLFKIHLSVCIFMIISSTVNNCRISNLLEVIYFHVLLNSCIFFIIPFARQQYASVANK